MGEIDTALVIDVARIDPEGEVIEGEVDCVDIDEEFVKPFGGIRYRLTLQVLGTELLVRGHLEQDFDLVCSRCGRDFDDTVNVDDFTVSYDISNDVQEVVLTNDIRDSIILALPTYPVCEDACPGIEQKVALPADDRWGALDNLKNLE
jgi:uncharacterized metal-binding protein YceD (DUF177 family)